IQKDRAGADVFVCSNARGCFTVFVAHGAVVKERVELPSSDNGLRGMQAEGIICDHPSFLGTPTACSITVDHAVQTAFAGGITIERADYITLVGLLALKETKRAQDFSTRP